MYINTYIKINDLNDMCIMFETLKLLLQYMVDIQRLDTFTIMIYKTKSFQYLHKKNTFKTAKIISFKSFQSIV